MGHHSRYGDGPANPSRPSLHKSQSHSFTAGSNPNSAPMPTFSGPRRRQSQSSVASRSSYTPQPEPAFDLMSSSQPMFGDVNFQPQMSFDLQGAMSVTPATTSYNSSALPPPNYNDNSFDSSTDQFSTNGLPDYDPNAFSADFAAAPDHDTPYARSAMGPPASKLDSPFTTNPPKLAAPTSASQAASTDSIHKDQPQTPRKVVKAKSAAAGRSQPLLPASADVRTPLAQRDPNSRLNKRNGPDSPTLDHTSPRKAAKRSKTDEPGRHREFVAIPDAEQFPPVDPGEDSAKPPYTYAQMIALAIWKGKDRRRTLSQIYDFIRTTWSYYQKEDTWENSIRHNLSLHKKFFEKKAREKDDPGKGNYWLIIPGNERELLEVYLKERSGHEFASMQSRSMSIMSAGRLEPSALPPPMSHQEPMLPPQLPHFQLQFPPKPKEEQRPVALAQPDPSTDATIPASDLAFDETDFADGPPNLNSIDGALTSSPPVVRRMSAPSDTPTHTAKIGAPSGRALSKHKRNSMCVDSGYMTGNSSILRNGQQRWPVFSSEGDPEFQGGGRAEDAIRRIRASSIVSPSEGQTLMLPPSSPFGKGSPLQYRASPVKLLASVKTPAKSSRILAGAPSLPPPPKANSKFNNSPIRQHDKLRANVRSMLQTPECIRDYNKKYPGRRQTRVDLDSFAIFEDITSGPEMESPLPANSAGTMLDELISAKRDQKTPLVASSPYKSFPLFPQGDENAPWTYDSPSKVLSTSSKFLTPSRFLPQSAKSVRFGTENWIVDEGLENDNEGFLASVDDVHVDLSNLGSYDDPSAGTLDLTQSFRSIGERPVGIEPYGPATLHQYG
ncbi:unnamed protein product [Discula destructiva]